MLPRNKLKKYSSGELCKRFLGDHQELVYSEFATLFDILDPS
jgi:hypothetical protein